MVGRLLGRLRGSLAAVVAVFRDRDLRRLELAWAASEAGDWVPFIALAVYTYEVGGATAVGLVSLVKLLPSAVLAPFTALLADYFRRERVMLAADIVRAAAMAAAAVVIWVGGPPAAVFALVALVSVTSTAFRPAQAALLPTLVRSPAELTAANVASSTIESTAMFVGPALGGAVLALAGTETSFLVGACTYAVSAILIAGIRGPHDRAEPGADVESPAAGALSRILGTAFAGFSTIAREPTARLLVGLFSANTLVAGALNVLLVVTALEVLDLPEAAVGTLFAAIGVGGVLGAAAALGLVGRSGLAAAFGIGLVFWGLPIALLAVFTSLPAALLLFAILGIANTVVDVAAITLLQRAVPDAVLARVFGVLESLVLATVALGSVVAAALIAWLGVQATLVVVGAFLPACALASWSRLRRVDEAAAVPARTLELLRGVSFLAPLPPAVLEQLAAGARTVSQPVGTRILTEGERGDHFYVIAAGEMEASIEGTSQSSLSANDWFGEIALIRDIPRTATVTATTDVELLGVERDDFLAAVTGYPPSAEAAENVVAARLAGHPRTIAPL